MNGTGSYPRFKAIETAISRVPRKFDLPKDESGRLLNVSEYFGSHAFDFKKMKDRLPKDVYQKLLLTVEEGKKLDREVADAVAHAVKEWALSQGATHFCHWFQPQTGSTAEKHDAFLTFDENEEPIERFSGFQLIQSEPDASSFPSGGMRATFEARGYTAWDPSSPMFIMESVNGKTLCIPSAFISYHGDALDEKTALLRSMDTVSKKAVELLEVLGETGVKRVIPTLGVEQEYFLLDRSFYSLRPDLIMAGRSLFGGQPPRGQQMEDHYFGSIPNRTLAFMSEVEYELYKLGVPSKTRHNEVAPSQFELAPIFEEANVACDHNQITMEILRKVAKRHHLEVLLHEKPFAGLNGSGKHSNWSMAIHSNNPDLDGENLLEPGKTPRQNLRFLVFLLATMKGVHKHAGLLRAAIGSPGNDHRLGANEAPPAIISVFLGEQLSEILNEIESGMGRTTDSAQVMLELGVSKIPQIMKDNTDRNRTSPFAFTGNKFEFRAVGSSAAVAFPVTMLNAAVADGISDVSSLLKMKIQSGVSKDQAILDVLKELVTETKAIRFEGNNYSDDWVKEAESRGLPNYRKTPEALEELVSSRSKQMLMELGILSEAELQSRYNVRLERYIKTLQIEVDTLKHMVDTQILPATYEYYAQLASGVATAKAAGVSAPQTEILKKIESGLNALQQKRTMLETLSSKADGIHDESQKARMFSGEVLLAMEEIRMACDRLEGLVSDASWPLPKYREMLFLA